MAFVPPFLIARRFVLCSAICGVSASPSFMLGRMCSATIGGMASGVLLFVVAYTLFTSTTAFDRIYRGRSFVRSTMYVGYGLRMLLSGLAAISITDSWRGPRVIRSLGLHLSARLAWPDLYCGAYSIRIVQSLADHPLGISNRSTLPFNEAFLITCVQGAILNVIVFVVMAIVYGLQLAFRTPPAIEGGARRGFDVLSLTND